VSWLLGFATIFALYVFYQPWEEWWYLRFLQPLLPALFALTSIALAALLAPLDRLAPRLATVALLIIVGAMAWRRAHYAVDQGAAVAWRAEQRYAETGAFIARELPERAALLSMQHSCSARYYSGRVTIRYDIIQPGELDAVVRTLQRLGYSPYLVLDDWEEPIYERRFAGQTAGAARDWLPVAAPAGGSVRIYALKDSTGSIR
jgi:hypothetical protein